jgi:hypothetical protein
VSVAWWAVQVALAARWLGWAPLAALVGDRIYDGRAPDGAEKPYIVIDSPTEVPQGTFGRDGANSTLSAHVHSDFDGAEEIAAVMKEMFAALAEPLVLDGHTRARLRRDFATVLVEGDSRHAPVRFRALTMETV